MRNAVTVKRGAVVDTNSCTASPGCTLTRSANPSMACSGPGEVSGQAAGTPTTPLGGAAADRWETGGVACGLLPVQALSAVTVTTQTTAAACHRPRRRRVVPTREVSPPACG